MKPDLVVWGVLLALLVAGPFASVNAQDDIPLVGFVVDADLQTAYHTDLGVGGLNRFAEVFRAYGAEVTAIDLSRPIPDEVDLVVLVRPVRPLTLSHAARLWIYLQKGKNLLLALDPENYYIGSANINTQIARSGLTTLLTLDYGISLRDSFLVEPWFTLDSITNLETTYSRAFVDVVSHPVTDQLAAFDVPVYVWGARSMTVEAIGIDSQAVPLLYNSQGYAETSPRVFRVLRGSRFENASEPLQENIGTDFLGWANLAALAENTRTGSRVVVLGDSEMLLNAYGFAGAPEARLYPGNVIFAQNLAGWLLELPGRRWLGLPPGFTWLTVDGSDGEWPETATPIMDPIDAGVTASLDIRQVRAFHDDIYTYLFVETWERPNLNGTVTFTLTDGARIEVTNGSVQLPATADPSIPWSGSAVAARTGIELRLPSRAVSAGIADVCLHATNSSDMGISDCLGQAVAVTAFNTRAPFDRSLASGLLVRVSNNTDVNLRSGPGTATAVVTMVPNGTVFAAVGRNNGGDWVQVQNAGLAGWLSAGLVVANGDIQTLPVVEDGSG
jgi:hypothetical protein